MWAEFNCESRVEMLSFKGNCRSCAIKRIQWQLLLFRNIFSMMDVLLLFHCCYSCFFRTPTTLYYVSPDFSCVHWKLNVCQRCITLNISTCTHSCLSELGSVYVLCSVSYPCAGNSGQALQREHWKRSPVAVWRGSMLTISHKQSYHDQFWRAQSQTMSNWNSPK